MRLSTTLVTVLGPSNDAAWIPEIEKDTLTLQRKTSGRGERMEDLYNLNVSQKHPIDKLSQRGRQKHQLNLDTRPFSRNKIKKQSATAQHPAKDHTEEKETQQERLLYCLIMCLVWPKRRLERIDAQ